MSIEEGRSLRDEGAAIVTENAPDAWRIVADDTILNFAAEGKPFTACMVRDLMSVVHPGLEPHHPNAWGARFLSAQKEGIIRTAGFESSPRKSRHGAIQRVWEGC